MLDNLDKIGQFRQNWTKIGQNWTKLDNLDNLSEMDKKVKVKKGQKVVV